MNTYIYHMLLRAREIDGLNFGLQGRDTPKVAKCPFCIADEDETWFKHRGLKKRSEAPYCMNCPLLSVLNIPIQGLMDDCYEIGKFILKTFEERGDDV